MLVVTVLEDKLVMTSENVPFWGTGLNLVRNKAELY